MTATSDPPRDVVAFASRLADTLATAMGYETIGVYLHGSAALGGFVPGVSDVDILAVVARPHRRRTQRRLGQLLRAAADTCPGSGLEASIITAATARSLGDCRFEVHVTTSPGDQKLVCGAHHCGDPDLVLHSAVCRQHGVAIAGPPPQEVFGLVPRQRILTALLHELRWAKEHGTEAYAVLNACRAWRYIDDDTFTSKIEAGAWAIQHGAPNVVADALTQQRSGRHRTEPSPLAQRFVDDIEHRIEAATP